MATLPTAGEVHDWLASYYHDAPGFIRATWQEEPDPWQIEVLDWVFKDGVRRVAIPSGHGVGKTACAAWASILALLTRFPVKVIQTAPSSATLQDGLFAETKMWAERLPPVLRDLIEITSDRIVLKAAPASAFLSVRTARADTPDALQGIHADNVFLVPDEASGIPDAVFEAAQGSMQGPARFMFMLGNPVYASGYFYNAITTNKDTVWKVRTVPTTESPRHSPEFVDEIAATYGEDSNVYRYRVLGLPPKGDDDTIIPLHYVQEAYTRDVKVPPKAPIYWGLDVARLGANESALAKRQGPVLMEPVTRFAGLELMQLCGRIAADYLSLQSQSSDLLPVQILIDGIGMGAGVVDRLRELGLPAVAVNVSEHQSWDPAYHNLKAQLWWQCRAWFAGRTSKLPSDAQGNCTDPELVRALTCVRIAHHSTGKLMVESKDSLKRRLKQRLPRLDAADAFVLTFAGTAAVLIHGRQSSMQSGAIKRNLHSVA